MSSTYDFDSLSYSRILAVTEKALLLELPDREKFWLPRSLLEDPEEHFEQDDDAGELSVATWFLKKEGLL